jgi:hypothetical protein
VGNGSEEVIVPWKLCFAGLLSIEAGSGEVAVNEAREKEAGSAAR